MAIKDIISVCYILVYFSSFVCSGPVKRRMSDIDIVDAVDDKKFGKLLQKEMQAINFPGFIKATTIGTDKVQEIPLPAFIKATTSSIPSLGIIHLIFILQSELKFQNYILCLGGIGNEIAEISPQLEIEPKAEGATNSAILSTIGTTLFYYVF